MRRVIRGLLSLDRYGSPIVAEVGKIRTGADGAGSAIGRALFALNAEGVAQCYDEDADPLAAELSRSFTYCASARKVTRGELVDSYKALRCLRYQCHEGTCGAAPLFAELTRAGTLLAEEIVSRLPEYEAAAWD